MRTLHGIPNLQMFMKDIKGGEIMTISEIFSWITIQGDYIFKEWDEETETYTNEGTDFDYYQDKTILYMYAEGNLLVIEVEKK